MIQRAATRIVFALYALVAVVSVLLARGDADGYTIWLARTRALGWVALAGLCCALCVTPLARSRVMRLGRAAGVVRRAFGIGAAVCALLHATAAACTVAGVWPRLWQDPQLRAGVVALLVMLLLWATSYPAWVRRVGLRSWKELHRLAYVALLFSFLHAALGPFAPLRALAWLLASTLVLGLLRCLPQPSAAEVTQPEPSDTEPGR